MNKIVKWDDDKNELIKKIRWVCFEDVLLSEIIDILEHPNKEKYPNQKIFLVKIWWYPYICPYVENDDFIIFKNIISW